MKKIVLFGLVAICVVVSLLVFLVTDNKQNSLVAGTQSDKDNEASTSAKQSAQSRSDGLGFDALLQALPTYEKPSAEAFKAFHQAEIDEFRQQKDFLAYFKKYAYSESHYDRQKALRGWQTCRPALWPVVNGIPTSVYPPIESTDDPRFVAWKELQNGCDGFVRMNRQERLVVINRAAEILKSERGRIETAVRNLRSAPVDSRAGLLAEIEQLLSNHSAMTLDYLSQLLTNTERQIRQVTPLDEVKYDAFSAALCDFMRECGPNDRRGRDRCFAWADACNLTESEQIRLFIQMREQSQAHVEAFDKWRQLYVEALRKQDWKTILEIK